MPVTCPFCPRPGGPGTAKRRPASPHTTTAWKRGVAVAVDHALHAINVEGMGNPPLMLVLALFGFLPGGGEPCRVEGGIGATADVATVPRIDRNGTWGSTPDRPDRSVTHLGKVSVSGGVHPRVAGGRYPYLPLQAAQLHRVVWYNPNHGAYRRLALIHIVGILILTCAPLVAVGSRLSATACARPGPLWSVTEHVGRRILGPKQPFVSG